MSGFLDLVCKGISAVSGIIAFVLALYIGLALIWMVMKEPMAFALVFSASIIGAAIFFRQAPKTYNLQMGHPDTERVMEAIAEMARKFR